MYHAYVVAAALCCGIDKFLRETRNEKRETRNEIRDTRGEVKTRCEITATQLGSD